jgi:hypothetical protein
MDNTQLPAEVVEKILRARDALIFGDRDEAYHQLYGIASPGYDSFTSWRDMEQQINYPAYSTVGIMERRKVTECASELHQARTLIEKFISRHEGGLLPDMFIYNEIKNFLDGK